MLDVDKTLPKDPDELRQFTALLLAEVKSQAVLIEKLRHQLAGHRNHRFGSSSESIEQLQLALETSEIAVAKMTAKLRLPDEEPKDQPKRRPIPDHIPRMEVELTTGDDDCAHCGGGLRRLGEDATEELEYVPGRFIVNRIVRPRFACSCCEAFTQAALPSRPIERGRPGPGLLAHVLVNKYADHLPLYRQSGIFERDGIEIDRSTLADWVGKSTALLEPLADAIGRHVLAGQAIFADDTPVKMLAPGTGKTATARLWAYGRDERPWGSDVPPASWYQFSPDRKGQHPKDHLAKYRGWMLADGYAGFEDLYRSGDIREVACMAHGRCRFGFGDDIAASSFHSILPLRLRCPWRCMANDNNRRECLRRRFEGLDLANLELHSAADSQTGATGDIEIKKNDGSVFEAIEVKHGIPVSLDLVVDAAKKLVTRRVDRFYVLTTHKDCGQTDEVAAKIKEVRERTGCQVIANGVIPTMRYYLRLVQNPADIFPHYTSLLKVEPAISHEHRVKWNDIVLPD